ncbi:hypothetical protein Plhal710r2_c006g0027111 [Plasmopara halstedii]
MNKYFARQFDNLLLPRTSRCLLRPCYIQCVFSSLHSSSVRYKLRILFLEVKTLVKTQTVAQCSKIACCLTKTAIAP